MAGIYDCYMGVNLISKHLHLSPIPIQEQVQLREQAPELDGPQCLRDLYLPPDHNSRDHDTAAGLGMAVCVKVRSGIDNRGPSLFQCQLGDQKDPTRGQGHLITFHIHFSNPVLTAIPNLKS